MEIIMDHNNSVEMKEENPFQTQHHGLSEFTNHLHAAENYKFGVSFEEEVTKSQETKEKGFDKQTSVDILPYCLDVAPEPIETCYIIDGNEFKVTITVLSNLGNITEMQHESTEVTPRQSKDDSMNLAKYFSTFRADAEDDSSEESYEEVESSSPPLQTTDLDYKLNHFQNSTMDYKRNITRKIIEHVYDSLNSKPDDEEYSSESQDEDCDYDDCDDDDCDDMSEELCKLFNITLTDD